VVAAPVEVRDVPLEREWVGQTLGSADVAVRSRVAGIVLGIHFGEGLLAEKGDLLFTIDPAEQQEKTASAESNVAVARTRLAQAEADLGRIRPLAEMNAVSRRDLDAAVASRVVAPISGLAGISEVRVGDYVSPMGANSLLVTLSDLDPIHARFFVSEAEYLDLSQRFGPPSAEPDGDPGILQLVLADGSVHPARGRVLKVDRGINPATGALAVEAAFPNTDRRLRPGLFARIRGVVETRKGALLVPQRAVQELQGRYHVFVLGEGDTVVLRPVAVGLRVGDQWLIEEGLAAGERVVVDGVQKIRSGMKVTVAAPAGS
jgi:membrane fusion protein (multidrug efflux system)